MKSVLAALRTLLVLAASLAVLALAAWLVGELPAKDAIAARREAAEVERARQAAEATRRERARAAAEAAQAREALDVDAGVDAGLVVAPGLPRHRICDEASSASLMRARLDARGRELLGIGCGDSLEVVGFVDTTPVLVARLTPSDLDQSAPVRRFSLLAEDVTGDGMIDWLVGTSRSVDAASPAVGSLHLIPGDGRGGLSEARLLAPIAVAALEVGRADEDELLDIAVLHRPDPLGSRAPEVWVFRGGASVVRLARAPVASDVLDIAMLDLDADGFSDVVPVRSTGTELAILAGNGAGAFSRVLPLAAVPASRVHRALVPGVGPRLLLVGSSPSFVTPGAPSPTVTPVGLPTSPRATDLHVDPANDTLRISALVEGELRWFEWSGADLRRVASLAVPTSAGRILDALAGDFTADAGLELALLVERVGAPVERDLVLVRGLGDEGSETTTLDLAAERLSIARAPLHLTIPLR